MIVCPVCEHAQARGEECEVCGRKLSGPGAVAVPVPLLEGLEPTRLGAAEDAPAETVPGLEPTIHPGGEAPAAPALGVEPTRAAPVAVEVEPLPGLERTEADPIPGDGPTPAGLLTCRYCRTPALPGEVICGTCGMRLPVETGPLLVPADDPEPIRCPACGTVGRGTNCSGCGGLLRRGG